VQRRCAARRCVDDACAKFRARTCSAHCCGVRVRYVDPKRPVMCNCFQCALAVDKMAGRRACAMV
jgi:hypothetical protein